MKTDKDYYSILGVLPSIEANALDAVYKALVKKYHPDVYAGDKKIAEEKTKEINEAYSVLRDPVKRKQYDEQRQKENKGFGNFEQENSYEGDNEILIQQVKNDWKIVVEFYPAAEKFRVDLNKISEALAFTYQVILIDTRNAANNKILAEKIKFEYLKSYFGENKEIQDYAERLIKSNQKEAAIYLNSVIRIIGSPKDIYETDKIIQTIKSKYEIKKQTEYLNPLYLFIMALLLISGFIISILAMKQNFK